MTRTWNLEVKEGKGELRKKKKGKQILVSNISGSRMSWILG